MVDMPRVYEQTSRKARKPHKCAECLGAIEKGEVYVRASGLWEGEWAAYTYHACCMEGRLEVLADMDPYDEGIPMDQGILEQLHGAGWNRNDDGWDLYPD